jgi:1,4-dihydroxy-2-naphthoate octaprenyltransferase
MRLLYALFGMSRPIQLVAVSLVYTLGTFIAMGQDIELNESTLLLGYLALIPTSASIHFANEYADHETDALTERTPFSGGSGALQRTGVHPVVAIRAAWVSLILGAVIYVTAFMAGFLTLSVGAVLAFGAFFGWMYSLPPLQLAWHGWGELDNALLGGVALPVYGYTVHVGSADLAVVIACIPFGLLVFINLLATTWADRDADAKVGKFTLATRWSIPQLRRLYLLGAISPFVLLSLFSGTLLPEVVVTSSFLVIPLVAAGAITYTRIHNPFPTVSAMVAHLLIQIVAWASVLCLTNLDWLK